MRRMMIAQRPLKIGAAAPTNGNQVLNGVYKVHMIGGGGGGYNLDAFDSGLDGARGQPGANVSANFYFSSRTIRQDNNAFARGAGGTVNTAPAAGNTGIASVLRSNTLALLLIANGGAGGAATNTSPWGARPSAPSGFPFGENIGRGGDGAIGGAGGQAATAGMAGDIYLEKIA